MKGILSIIAIALTATTSVTVSAKDIKTAKLATEHFYGSTVGFSANGIAQNTTLSIIGPNGFAANKSTVTGTPSIDLTAFGNMADGVYNYEMTTSAGPMVLIEDKINNGRGDKNSHYARKGVTQSGHFRVVNGQIKQYKSIKETTSNTTY